MLLLRRDNLHVYGYTPLGHPESKKQAVGSTVRFRGRGRWRWLQAQLYWPRRDLWLGRGCVSMEFTTWRTDARTGDRVSVKTFLRLKAGLGGRRA